MRLKAFSRVAAAATVIVLGTLPALAATQDSVHAVWAPRKVSFIYQGFTTHYSCDGLRETIRHMLLELGARDLKVSPRGCIRMTGVEPFPGVRVTMQVLVPLSPEHGKKTGPVVAAHWRKVVLMPGSAGFEEQGNCELIEQFKETFLPLFTTRRIDYQSNCVPHQLTLGTHLAAEVLMPEATPRPGG